MFEENGSKAATGLLCLMACREPDTLASWSLCTERTKPRNSVEVKRSQEVASERGAQHGFEAGFETLQPKILEMS